MKIILNLFLVILVTSIHADNIDNQYMYQNDNGNRTYYGNDGSYQGQSIDNNNGARYYYNKNGQMSGWTQQNQNGGTYYYDSTGKMTGFSN